MPCQYKVDGESTIEILVDSYYDFYYKVNLYNIVGTISTPQKSVVASFNTHNQPYNFHVTKTTDVDTFERYNLTLDGLKTYLRNNEDILKSIL